MASAALLLVWSDIPNNVQMRWIEEDGRITTFRNPSGYSNGNTFDFEGRQLPANTAAGASSATKYDEHRHAPSPTSSKASASTRSTTSSRPPRLAQHLVHPIRHYGINGNYERASGPPKKLKEAVYRVDPENPGR